jgi:hypothetical protein
MAVTLKNAVFWDVAPCEFIINTRFGGTCGVLMVQLFFNLPPICHTSNVMDIAGIAR